MLQRKGVDEREIKKRSTYIKERKMIKGGKKTFAHRKHQWQSGRRVLGSIATVRQTKTISWL